MIAVIDYESGNLRSISKALEEVGARVKVTDSKKVIARAKGIVLPGVGAFHHGMEVLKRKGLLSSILSAIREGKAFLGICLGMQLLFSESEEHGLHKGLGVIKGRVKRFPSKVKIPHLGWNQVEFTPHLSTAHASKEKGTGLTRPGLADTINSNFGIFDKIPDNTNFYFVHSYYVEPEDKNITAAKTSYGVRFTSSIVKDNIWGVQFHPEKSSEAGLKILENFYRQPS